MKLAREFVVPLVIACAFFMEQIDGSIITTAIPKIASSLHTDPLHLNLAITSYMLSLSVFIPLSGWIADRFGARNIFRLAIVLFILGSLACGLSNNLWQLVMARIFQGFGGAMMMPIGRLVLLRTIPKAKLVDAIALMTAPAMIGPILGPPIGGIIVTYASWRWIFFINVPIGIVGFLLATRYFEPIRGRKREPLDFTGFTLLALSLSGLMFFFETIGRNLTSEIFVYGSAALGALTMALYYIHTRRIKHPVVDLRPMRYQTYRSALMGGSLFRIGVGAMPFLLPLMLQYGFGMSPAMSGFITLAGAAGAILMKIAARTVIRAMGFRHLLIWNTVLNALFFAGCAFFTKNTGMGLIFVVLLIGGVFRSLQFTSLNTVAYADIPEYLLSRANTLYSMAQQLTLSMGVATGAFLLNLSLRFRGSAHLEVQDFWTTFWILAGLCLVSVASFLPLPANAGAEVSGHKHLPEDSERNDPV